MPFKADTGFDISLGGRGGGYRRSKLVTYFEEPLSFWVVFNPCVMNLRTNITITQCVHSFFVRISWYKSNQMNVICFFAISHLASILHPFF